MTQKVGKWKIGHDQLKSLRIARYTSLPNLFALSSKESIRLSTKILNLKFFGNLAKIMDVASGRSLHLDVPQINFKKCSFALNFDVLVQRKKCPSGAMKKLCDP